MSTLNIQVQTVNDPPPLPEYKTGSHLHFEAAVIVEKATNGNRTGVMLCFTDPQTGKKYFATTTARMIANGLASVIRGACDRFKDDLRQP